VTRVNVFITVDIEPSIGGAFRNPNLRPVGTEKRIYGRVGNRYYGIPLIMDIADQYNIPLTFFVEVLNKYFFGEEETKEVCQYIISRGHDVQLHLHPNYLNFLKADRQKLHFSDNISDYNFRSQVDLIREGKDLLLGYGVRSAVAFRAGNYGANGDTIKALRQNAFLIDSSYNLGNPRCTKIVGRKINDVTNLGGVWEFPITCFIESVPFRQKRFKPLDINGVSFQEIESVLNKAHLNGPQNITIILHSFSFLNTYDLQYAKVKPRWRVIERFKKLCQFLSKKSSAFEPKTLGNFGRNGLFEISLKSRNFFPHVSTVLSLSRGIGQLWDYLLCGRSPFTPLRNAHRS